MNIGIIKESLPYETRVAATPGTVAQMNKLELPVFIESNAGLLAGITDHDYQQAGATVLPSSRDVLQKANIVLKIQAPSLTEINELSENTALIAPLYPLQHPVLIQQLAARHITAYALDLVPRIARAQSMDILSSMSNLAGYKSVLLAANALGKLFPMMTTAAGTIPPAKVIVIGVGVAGLQAIATARRLGAVVIAFDTRSEAEEQAKSLGADFVKLEISAEQTILAPYIKDADIVITTALIPGKRAPLLISNTMVKSMRPGSVIVDLAVEQQGNCELSQAGEIIKEHDVVIIGLLNLPSLLPNQASQLFAKNIFNFLKHIIPSLTSSPSDITDEIIKNTLMTYHGEIIHPMIKQCIDNKGILHAS